MCYWRTCKHQHTRTHTHMHIYVHISSNQPNIRWTWLNNFHFQYCAELSGIDELQDIVHRFDIANVFVASRVKQIDQYRKIGHNHMMIHYTSKCVEEDYWRWRNKRRLHDITGILLSCWNKEEALTIKGYLWIIIYLGK